MLGGQTSALGVEDHGQMREEEIAAEREVSVPTVRTQIRQVLEKTGALHLRDLVRLVAALPAVRRSETVP